VPTQDIVLGLYYMTRSRPSARQRLSLAVRRKSESRTIKGKLNFASITARIGGERIETTVGAYCLRYRPANDSVQRDQPGHEEKELANLIDVSYRLAGKKQLSFWPTA
jgi:DNA-directed RNA polymerase subunit beta'